MLHADFNVRKALQKALQTAACCCSGAASQLIMARCAAERKEVNIYKKVGTAVPRRPAPRSRDQCQKHDLGVTALSFSSAVSRTQAAARVYLMWCV